MLAFLLISPFSFAQYTLQDADVVVTNGQIMSCSITDFNTASYSNGSIIIPQILDGDTVKKIGTEVLGTDPFANKSITSLTLPSSVQTIGNKAFYNNSISSIDLSSCTALQLIADNAFAHNSISSVNLSACTVLQSIGFKAFYNNSISSLDLSTCTLLQSIGDKAFSYNSIPSLDLSACTILQSIGNSAFYNNSISSLDISTCTALQSIEDKAFSYNSISSFNLPQNIPGYTFNWKDGNNNTYADGATVSNLTLGYTANLTATGSEVSFTIKNAITDAVIQNAVIDLGIYGTRMSNTNGIAIFESVDDIINLPYVVSKDGYSTNGIITIASSSISENVFLCQLYEDTFSLAVCNNELPYILGSQSLTLAGQYTETFTSELGCDSVVTLNLTINSNTGTDVQTACDTYTWIDGVTYTASNNTATHTLVNTAGCDSVVTLNLTINNSTTGIDTQTACDTYTWIDGNTYTASNNIATHTLVNAAGCDSVVNLNLIINNSNTGIDTQTACNTYTWIDGITYTASNNTATHTLVNAAGCDSVVTLNLTINNSNTGVDTQTACDTYTWIDGNTYTVNNNIATHTLVNAAGCDSVVTLNLTINNSNTGIDVQTACDTYTWIDGITYTASNNIATHTLTNAVGCDSVVTLNLTINNSNTGIDTQTACDTYTWIDGNTYTASNNIATHTLISAAGCDSVVTLNLIINNSNTGIDTQTACDTYTWIDGNTYTASNNTAMHTLTNAAGCDSVVTLDLTINPSPIINCPQDTNITSNNIITLPIATPQGGVYTGVGISNNQFDPAGLANGTYTITYTYQDPVTLCEAFCEFDINLGIIGIQDIESNIECNVYPNPTSDACTLSLTLPESQEVIIRLINNLGQQIELRKLNSSKEFNQTFDFSKMAPGVYSILINVGGEQITKRVILK